MRASAGTVNPLEVILLPPRLSVVTFVLGSMAHNDSFIAYFTELKAN